MTWTNLKKSYKIKGLSIHDIGQQLIITSNFQSLIGKNDEQI